MMPVFRSASTACPIVHTMPSCILCYYFKYCIGMLFTLTLQTNSLIHRKLSFGERMITDFIVSINHEASQLAHMTMGTGKLSFFLLF